MVELDTHYSRVQKFFRVKGSSGNQYRPSMTNYTGDIYLKQNKKLIIIPPPFSRSSRGVSQFKFLEQTTQV
jgi:hypothetical protein